DLLLRSFSELTLETHSRILSEYISRLQSCHDRLREWQKPPPATQQYASRPSASSPVLEPLSVSLLREAAAAIDRPASPTHLSLASLSHPQFLEGMTTLANTRAREVFAPIHSPPIPNIVHAYGRLQ